MRNHIEHNYNFSCVAVAVFFFSLVGRWKMCGNRIWKSKQAVLSSNNSSQHEAVTKPKLCRFFLNEMDDRARAPLANTKSQSAHTLKRSIKIKYEILNSYALCGNVQWEWMGSERGTRYIFNTFIQFQYIHVYKSILMKLYILFGSFAQSHSCAFMRCCFSPERWRLADPFRKPKKEGRNEPTRE